MHIATCFDSKDIGLIQFEVKLGSSWQRRIKHTSLRMHKAQRESDSIFGLDDLGYESWQRREIFFFSKFSRPALGPTYFPVQWVLGFFPKSGVRVCC
jgi:hypothetical protein